jgi:DNA-binding NarL/FixJ family response regulator
VDDALVPMRVVIVDDDARFCALARRTLEAEGVDVIAEAANGTDAIAGMAAWDPDVVLLDIGLPDLDGLEVARRLRAAASTLLVILVSTRDVDYGRRVSTGLAAGYLPKDQIARRAIEEVIGQTPSPTT